MTGGRQTRTTAARRPRLSRHSSGLLRETWEATYGPGSVTGLAPSAAAAGIPTADLDARITEARYSFDRWRMKPGQLFIVDEASLADTKTLDAIATQARNSGGKVVLVGDPAQLSAVGAGGAFAMLTRARPDAPTLDHVRRFKNRDGTENTAEASASIRLRSGDPQALAHDRERGRIHTAADGADTLQQAHAAWKADRAMGLRSILIAADNDTVTALNLIAQADLIQTGTVQPGRAALVAGTRAGIGDRIVTRKVDRNLADGTARSRAAAGGVLTAGYVTNGAAFTVTGHTAGGGLVVRADRGTAVVLPADYVAQHVQLGYAVTAHRAQGTTVDTAHVIAATGMTREAFYVAMTRGRYANHVHVITDRQPDTDRPDAPATADTQAVLEQILANTGQELSAHDTRAQLEHQAQQWISRREADTGARLPQHDLRSGPAHSGRQPALRPSEQSARQLSSSRRDTRQQPPSRGVAR